MPLNYEALIKQLKSKEYKPVYLLHGLEHYYIDKAAQFFENEILTNEEKSFNQQIFYGNEVDNLKNVFTACQQYPFMASIRLVIVKEAHLIKDFKLLEKYLPVAVPSTVLVFVYKKKESKFDTRTKVFKGFEKYGEVFESVPVNSKNLESWLKSECVSRGINITPNGISYLSSYLGNNLESISDALTKIKLNIGDGVVDERVVLENVSLNIKYNVFELVNALGKKDKVRVIQIVNYLSKHSKDEPIQKIISILNGYFSKLTSLYYSNYSNANKERKSEIISELGLRTFTIAEDLTAANLYGEKLIKVMSCLLEYDGYSKGVNANQQKEGELLKELVFKIINF